MNQEQIIKMALDSGMAAFKHSVTVAHVTDLERFADMVAAAERKNKTHSLDPGQMELSLRREHKGELFECQYRFTAEQVMHGQDWMVTEVAKQLDTEIDRSIRARGQA